MSKGTGAATVNPLAAINQEAYNAEHHTAVLLGVAGLETRAGVLRTDLDAAVREAGDDFDVALVVTLKGDTPEATLGNIVDRHSELSAVQNILNQKRAIIAQVQRRAAMDGLPDDDSQYDDLYNPPTNRRANIGAALHTAFTEAGLNDYGEALRRRVAFDLNLGSRPLAATLKTDAGFPPESTRSDRIATLGRAALTLLDIIPDGSIGQAAHVYMREGLPVQTDAAADASAAATRSEEAALAESTFTWEQVTDTVRSIGHFLPVTEEQLMDAPRIESLVEGRMLFGVRQQANKQLISGNGTAPNLKGLLGFKYDGTSAATQAVTFNRITLDLSDQNTDAKMGKAILLALRQAMTLNYTAGAVMPSHILINPFDQEKISLLETASAGFYAGDPRVSFGNMIWGVPTVLDMYGLDEADTAGNIPALVGDFVGYSEVLMRHDYRVEFGMNADDFRDLRRSVRAYVRAVFSLYRLRAFTQLEVVA